MGCGTRVVEGKLSGSLQQGSHCEIGECFGLDCIAVQSKMLGRLNLLAKRGQQAGDLLNQKPVAAPAAAYDPHFGSFGKPIGRARDRGSGEVDERGGAIGGCQAIEAAVVKLIAVQRFRSRMIEIRAGRQGLPGVDRNLSTARQGSVAVKGRAGMAA